MQRFLGRRLSMQDGISEQPFGSVARGFSDYDQRLVYGARLSQKLATQLLKSALEHNIPFCDVLYARGHVDRTTLFRTYAQSQDARFVDLRRRPCETATAKRANLTEVLKTRCIGWMTNSLGQIVYATPNLSHARKMVGDDVFLVVVEDYAFEEEVQRLFQQELLADATGCTPLELSARYEHNSRVLRPLLYSLCFILMAYICISYPVVTLGSIALLLTLFVAVMCGFRALLLFSAATNGKHRYSI
jgi:hypothetical protein